MQSDDNTNFYIVDINGKGVRTHEKKNGEGFGLNMKDLAKAYNYGSIDELKASKEFKELSQYISGQTSKTRTTAQESKETEIKFLSDIDFGTMSYSSPAFYAGGTLDQAVNLAENPYRKDDVVNFLVTHSGLVVANNALIRGRLESNSKGNVIIIDPESASIELKDENGKMAGRWRFNAEFGFSDITVGEVSLNNRWVGNAYNGNAGSYRWEAGDQGIGCSEYDTEEGKIKRGFNVIMDYFVDYLPIMIRGLPRSSSSSNVPKDMLYYNTSRACLDLGSRED